MSPLRLAKLAVRSASAIAIMAQLDGPPKRSVAVLRVELSHTGASYYSILIRLDADQRYRVLTAHRRYPDDAHVDGTYHTLTEALLAVDQIERDYYDCAAEEAQAAIDWAHEEARNAV